MSRESIEQWIDRWFNDHVSPGTAHRSGHIYARISSLILVPYFAGRPKHRPIRRTPGPRHLPAAPPARISCRLWRCSRW